MSLSSHKWRYTLASTMLAKGASLKVVQNILGHYNISITSKYIHTTDEDSQACFKNIFE